MCCCLLLLYEVISPIFTSMPCVNMLTCILSDWYIFKHINFQTYLMQIKNGMKNGINTGQFHVKTGFLGNGRRNLISTSVNTETGSHKYENGRTKIENGTGWNGNISVRFQPQAGCSMLVPIQSHAQLLSFHMLVEPLFLLHKQFYLFQLVRSTRHFVSPEKFHR